MAQKVYDFGTPSDYTFDDTRIEVSSGLAKLKKLTSDDETFYASYNTDINGSRGDGVLTGTAYGGASVSGGKLDLAYDDLRYVDYDADLNADSPQTGCIRFKYTPNYNGANPTEQQIFTITKSPTLGANRIYLRQRSGTVAGGYLVLHCYDKDGALIRELLLGWWVAVKGVEYEFEINYDFTAGATRFFIDGVQMGSTATETGVRDSNIGLLRIGTMSTSVSNFKIDDFQVFSTVQHTSDYTPSPCAEHSYCTLKPTIYPRESWNPTSPLTMLSFTETLGANNEGSIGYQISTDLGVTWKYWDGSAFVIATSDQYNDADTINSVFTNLTLNSPDDDLLMKAILISNGEQQCELDTMVIEILKDINNLIISVDFPRQVVLGDTIDIKCTMNESIFDWKIKCKIEDASNNSIELANTLAGGSDSQIDIIDQVNGTFFIRVAKDLTTDFDNKANIEIEIENSAGNIYTIWQYNFKLKNESIT